MTGRFDGRGGYYRENGIDPIGAFELGLVSREQLLGFYKCNVIKYVARCEYKDDPLLDLEKARDYVDLMIRLYESSGD